MERAEDIYQMGGDSSIPDSESRIPSSTADNDQEVPVESKPDRGLVLRIHPCMIGMIAKTFIDFRYILIVDPEAEPGVIEEGSRYIG